MTFRSYRRAIVHQRIHVRRLAIQMHRHERPDAAAGGAIDQRAALAARTRRSMKVRTAAGDRLKVAGIDVAEHRPRARARDRARGRKERERAM